MRRSRGAREFHWHFRQHAGSGRAPGKPAGHARTYVRLLFGAGHCQSRHIRPGRCAQAARYPRNGHRYPADGAISHGRNTEPLRRKNSGALAPEEEIGEYNRLSDAPAVAQELASMRQTRLARTVLYGGADAVPPVFGPLPPARLKLPPTTVLDPHRPCSAALSANEISFCWP